MRRYILIFLMVAACMPQAPAEKPGGDNMDSQQSCNAAQWNDLIGQPATAANVIPEPKRIIAPGDAVTMDYLPERTNVNLDGAGRITDIRCG